MRLIGYIDGVEITFDFYPPNTFKAEIPKRLDGTYIVQLRAIDSAGNESNYSNVFIRIDFEKLNIQVLPLNFEYKNNEGYEIQEFFSKYVQKEYSISYSTVEISSEFSYKELII
jgi:hypothetical protein